MLAYRIFQIRNGRPATLYHGVNGSKVIPLDRFVEATRKTVHENGRLYLSGFHVLPSEEGVRAYLERRFKKPRDLVICPVVVRGEIREKPGSPVILADRMLVRAADWEAARVNNIFTVRNHD